ncbi:MULTISPECIES: PEF-CTERM sorting domain-containing protein [unclassified Methanosarcina]|uniref:PEF-CTERM sorting domain-containing protein n=1 Tax=unclassified Methanosarcina TaxID=2644672 RepID=UPI0009E30D7E|nr:MULTISPECIES: PEF-CTERM sorting domain-containing protein [unclassified Methanosarcina]
MVGTASAETFLLTETTDDYNYGISIKVRVDYNPTDNTLTFQVIEPQNKVYDGYTISNVDLKNIWIKTTPDKVSVISPNNVWNDPANNHGSIGNFGAFDTQITKEQDIKSPGPVTIKLADGLTLDDLIANSNDGYVVAVHVGFQKAGVAGEIGCSGKVRGNTLIPEFPTVALPVAAIMGIMFIFGRRKQE